MPSFRRMGPVSGTSSTWTWKPYSCRWAIQSVQQPQVGDFQTWTRTAAGCDHASTGASANPPSRRRRIGKDGQDEEDMAVLGTGATINRQRTPAGRVVAQSAAPAPPGSGDRSWRGGRIVFVVTDPVQLIAQNVFAAGAGFFRKPASGLAGCPGVAVFVGAVGMQEQVGRRGIAVLVLTEIHHGVRIRQLDAGGVEVFLDQPVIAALHRPLHAGRSLDQHAYGHAFFAERGDAGDT